MLALSVTFALDDIDLRYFWDTFVIHNLFTVHVRKYVRSHVRVSTHMRNPQPE